MSFRRSRYFLGEAVRSLIRNRLMTVASILTVSSCILIVSVFFALTSNIEFFFQQLEGGIGIVIFVHEDVDAEGVMRIHDRLQEMPHIESVRYVPSQEAEARMRADMDDPGILDGVPVDNFRRSFEIEITDLRYHDAVVTALGNLRNLGVDRVRHVQEVAQVMTAISNSVRWVSLGLIAILAAVSIIIITNTIRITVNARKNEINIMKYVGATDWFIRWPFLIEGILIGVIGSLIPVSLVWSGYGRAVQMVRDALPLIGEVQFRASHEIFVYLFPFVIFLGAVIGTIGSGSSVRRYLHV